MTPARDAALPSHTASPTITAVSEDVDERSIAARTTPGSGLAESTSSDDVVCAMYESTDRISRNVQLLLGGGGGEDDLHTAPVQFADQCPGTAQRPHAVPRTEVIRLVEVLRAVPERVRVVAE